MAPAIAFDKQTRDLLARQLAGRLADTLGVEVAPFDALELLDHLCETLGPAFYNQGLYDAQAVIKDRADTIIEAIEQLEKPIGR